MPATCRRWRPAGRVRWSTSSSGAATMKMISSTSIDVDHRRDVDLGHQAARRRPRRPPPDEPAMFIAMMDLRLSVSFFLAVLTPPPLTPARRSGVRGSPKIRRRNPHGLGLTIHLRYELIIENSRGMAATRPMAVANSAGDARRHHREGGILRGGDRLETRHNAPDRAKQADERAGRAYRRQHQQPPFKPLDLPRDGNVHHFLDPHLKPGNRARLTFERTFPLAHRCNETRRHRLCRLGPTTPGTGPQSTPPTRRPARNGPSRAWCGRKERSCRIAIARTHTEQANRPNITAFTIKAACQNRVISDTSVETIGKVCGGGSCPVSSQRQCPKSPGGGRLPVPRPRVRHGGKPAREPRDVSHGWPVQSRVMNSPANMSKRGLFARRCVPNQTLIMVNGRLPKKRGILAA